MNEQIHNGIQEAVKPILELLHKNHEILDAHIKEEGAKVQEINNSHNRHLEIYAKNNIESKRVADALLKMESRAIARDEQIDLMWKSRMDELAVSQADKIRLQTVVLWGGAISAAGVIATLLVKLGN